MIIVLKILLKEKVGHIKIQADISPWYAMRIEDRSFTFLKMLAMRETKD